MIWWTCFLSFILEVLAASATSPLISKFGDSFRSGEVTVSLGGMADYDLSPTFTSALPSNEVGLVLSMVDYSQTFDASYKVLFHLY